MEATETTQKPAGCGRVQAIVRTSGETGVGSKVRYAVEGRETIEGVVLDVEKSKHSILDVNTGRRFNGVRYFVMPTTGMPFWTTKFRDE